MELSSSPLTHVCWSVPSLPVGKSMWDVKFVTGRWVGKIRIGTRAIGWGVWVWQGKMVQCIHFCIWDFSVTGLAAWILGPGHWLSDAATVECWKAVTVLDILKTIFKNFKTLVFHKYKNIYEIRVRCKAQRQWKSTYPLSRQKTEHDQECWSFLSVSFSSVSHSPFSNNNDPKFCVYNLIFFIVTLLFTWISK